MPLLPTAGLQVAHDDAVMVMVAEVGMDIPGESSCYLHVVGIAVVAAMHGKEQGGYNFFGFGVLPAVAGGPSRVGAASSRNCHSRYSSCCWPPPRPRHCRIAMTERGGHGMFT
jgi:hypothetical protein